MATLLACALPDWANLPGGVFSLYLVASGWAAVRRHRTQARLIDAATFGLGCLASGLAVLLAWLAQTSATGLVGGKAMPLFAVFAALSGFAIARDIMAWRRVQLSRVQLLRRHVWRMSTALFFGTGSFFLGQQKVMPDWARGSPVLFVLAFAPLALMLVWLFRANAHGEPPLAGARLSLARPAGLEPATHSLEGYCSIHLS